MMREQVVPQGNQNNGQFNPMVIKPLMGELGNFVQVQVASYRKKFTIIIIEEEIYIISYIFLKNQSKKLI